MSPDEDKAFVNEEAMKYWGAVDFYNGGSEHAVGHLLYSRMWTKVLHDLGFINFDEPFKKMVNQGMIQGQSKFILEALFLNCITDFGDIYISYDLLTQFENEEGLKHFIINEIEEKHNGSIDQKDKLKMQFNQKRVPVNYVDGEKLDFIALKLNEHIRFNSMGESIFITNSKSEFLCRTEVEKMSKSKYNVVNPDDMIAQYGADTFRMYEMFLGPIELSKPWDTKGIEGVSRFLRKFWNLFVDENGNLKVVNDTIEAAFSPSPSERAGVRSESNEAELKILHKTIKKINEDIEKLSYNTCVSQFMICVNELQAMKCNKQSVLEPLLILLNPFAPFITEYLWKQLNHSESIIDAAFPQHDEKYLIENSFSYPVAINGKTRVNLEFALDADAKEIESTVLADATIQKFMEGKPMKKFIFVKGRMINVVV
jgi:leucyl-tRNA synthetase